MQEAITSVQNKSIKQLLLLSQKSRIRKKTGTFVIEGQRELQIAVKSGFEILQIYYCQEIVSEQFIRQIQQQSEGRLECIIISNEVYQKVAYRSSTEGIVSVVKSKEILIEHLELPEENSLLLVAEAPEKPGNIGALLRTADAVKADAVILANPKTDLYNPNIIRSSIGCIFSNTVVSGSTRQIIDFLQKNHIQIISAALQNATNYTTIDYQKSTAIVVGTEDKGLSSDWIEHADHIVKIPMRGAIDSMNVSVAAGILLYEVDRQRSSK